MLKATKVLLAVVDELGGSIPTYETVSTVQYKIHFKIPLEEGNMSMLVMSLHLTLPVGTLCSLCSTLHS